eukprot:gnl/TRDRNA2_/TRDRNA2_144781_c0_seq1.p1 gnl/TRDRNA2_/TRDRNA2_144781_c0~~gnl/TRDRNA2_/TRDRNA2_144781_c0_seq1.p1  ORF type:complete len:169 (+),score=15.79 gnl/TRDRNA2_/TRDRNA2_144781_c0_seq1:77-583(+)
MFQEAERCALCGKRMGYILARKGFGFRELTHEARCSRRIPRESRESYEECDTSITPKTDAMRRQLEEDPDSFFPLLAQQRAAERRLLDEGQERAAAHRDAVECREEQRRIEKQARREEQRRAQKEAEDQRRAAACGSGGVRVNCAGRPIYDNGRFMSYDEARRRGWQG